MINNTNTLYGTNTNTTTNTNTNTVPCTYYSLSGRAGKRLGQKPGVRNRGRGGVLQPLPYGAQSVRRAAAAAVLRAATATGRVRRKPRAAGTTIHILNMY
jgi:hypothetical protein